MPRISIHFDSLAKEQFNWKPNQSKQRLIDDEPREIAKLRKTGNGGKWRRRWVQVAAVRFQIVQLVVRVRGWLSLWFRLNSKWPPDQTPWMLDTTHIGSCLCLAHWPVDWSICVRVYLYASIEIGRRLERGEARDHVVVDRLIYVGLGDSQLCRVLTRLTFLFLQIKGNQMETLRSLRTNQNVTSSVNIKANRLKSQTVRGGPPRMARVLRMSSRLPRELRSSCKKYSRQATSHQTVVVWVRQQPTSKASLCNPCLQQHPNHLHL